MPIVSLADVKTYLGLTGTGDDQMISNAILDAQGRIETDTGRIFAYSSNVTRTYSTEGQASINIRDVPSVASNTATVTLNGAAMSYGTGWWLLPDRRNPNVSVTIQLRFYDRTRADWWKASPTWFDANMDNPRYWASIGSPNDLVISGPEGHPTPAPGDVIGMHTKMAALMYWQAKSGASGTITIPTGETVDIGPDAVPVGYTDFVRRWAIHTAVAGV